MSVLNNNINNNDNLNNNINDINDVNDLNIVILAAGMGKRMYSKYPKVLHKIADKPMLYHVLDRCLELKPSSITVVIGHQSELVETYIENYIKKYTEKHIENLNININIKTALQTEQLGTGHALMQALPLLATHAPSLVLYGDVPLIQQKTLQDFINTYHSKNKLQNKLQKCMGILTANYENPTGYGRIIKNNQGNVEGIVEEKDANDAQKKIQEINTGMMLIPSDMLGVWLAALKPNNAQGEYYLTDVVGLAYQAGVEIFTCQPSIANWETFGVNNKLQLHELERTHQLQKANTLLNQGVGIIDAQRIDIRGDLTCNQDVEIDVGCIFKGRVHLGEGVKIAAYCILEDVNIEANTEILAYSHIQGADIAEDCQIGPYARIRPETKLAKGCKIGNFVEIKKTSMAEHSKANHLAYLGDAQIGTNVNIGAGVITCNYDGANKHQTIIEDDVFVGSDCQLIAPIHLARGSTIAAGTTLSKDAPANALSLSKRQQIAIENWQRPKKNIKKY